MNFSDIIGHQNQILKIKNIFESNKIPQTLLFSGISGIGKKTIAIGLIRYIFCKEKGFCNPKCDQCRRIEAETHPDFFILSPDEKGTIPVGKANEEGTVRWLIDKLTKKSISGKYGVIIDSPEKIPANGQNALLKTIEVPLPGTLIIIITSNKSLLLPTILSRCTEMSFNPLSLDNISLLLKKNVKVNSNFEKVVRFSGGSYEAALFLCEAGILDLFNALAISLTNYISKRDTLVFELDELLKKTHSENILNILINIFEAMLLEVYSKEFTFFSSLEIPSEKDIIKMIKILMLMRKGLVYNMNFYNTLKAIMYSFDSFPPFGIPSLENALGGAML
jgi:DNA polymerase-3 subunit delta'